MARKLGIEYASAMCHVIYRRNYRSWIFETKERGIVFSSFERSMFGGCILEC